jgi:tRNA-dihydrouridine synthase B
MRIGPYLLPNNLILAPMAGVSDQPFRQLCARFGAGLTVSEMVISHGHLQQHPRTLEKLDYRDDDGLRCVQILGNHPQDMAQAARLNVQRGAQIIDINMGCPAKKVCSAAAGSALMRDEPLVAQILRAVVAAVEVPVTLKMRTGWDTENRNALTIAKIAEDSGIQAVTVHGRSRACKFAGEAEYRTIAEVKQAVNIPVIANGDIDSPQKARQVLAYTGADALMIGRAAQGQPWIFSAILAESHQKKPFAQSLTEVKTTVLHHLDTIYHFYGWNRGVRMARKHIGWYFDRLGGLPPERKLAINLAESTEQQFALVAAAFNDLTR